MTPRVSVSLLLGLLIFVGSSALRSWERQPNLILILSDDHRWDVLGAAGNSKVHTPALDELAKEGVYYPSATIHVSQCHPSRATLMTGLPPHRHGVHSIQYLGDDPESLWQAFCGQPTLTSVLAAQGYRNVLVGKWHLDAEPWDCGFSEIKTWLPYGGGYYVDPDNLSRGPSRARLKIAGNTQEIFTQDALDFIRSPEALEQPFFLWFSPTVPHLPYGPNPPQFQALYEGKTNQDLLPPSFPPGDPIHDHWVEYYEGVSHLDDIVGRLMQALEQTDQLDDTVVVFMGDNGYTMGERGLGLKRPDGKSVPYEASLRVPLIIAGLPNLKGSDPSLASSLDIPPTLVSLAGAAVPEAWPGRDLMKSLRRREVLDEAFSEWSDDQSERFGHVAFRSIRTHRFKWIDWTDSQTPDELYDVVQDPFERRNLAFDPAFSDIAGDLSGRLDRWRHTTGDPTLVDSKSADSRSANSGEVKP